MVAEDGSRGAFVYSYGRAVYLSDYSGEMDVRIAVVPKARSFHSEPVTFLGVNRESGGSDAYCSLVIQCDGNVYVGSAFQSLEHGVPRDAGTYSVRTSKIVRVGDAPQETVSGLFSWMTVDENVHVGVVAGDHFQELFSKNIMGNVRERVVRDDVGEGCRWGPKVEYSPRNIPPTIPIILDTVSKTTVDRLGNTVVEQYVLLDQSYDGKRHLAKIESDSMQNKTVSVFQEVSFPARRLAIISNSVDGDSLVAFEECGDPSKGARFAAYNLQMNTFKEKVFPCGSEHQQLWKSIDDIVQVSSGSVVVAHRWFDLQNPSLKKYSLDFDHRGLPVFEDYMVSSLAEARKFRKYEKGGENTQLVVPRSRLLLQEIPHKLAKTLRALAKDTRTGRGFVEYSGREVSRGGRLQSVRRR